MAHRAWNGSIQLEIVVTAAFSLSSTREKDLILSKVVELIQSDIIKQSLPIECFIEHIQINLNLLSKEEKRFLKIFFDKFNNSNITTKTSILNMISHLSNKFINNWNDLDVFTK